jgi:hypothetical protein
VLARPERLPGGIAAWWRGLGRAGRAAVVAGTTSWCVALVHLLGGHPAIGWADPDRQPRRDLLDGAVSLRASLDARSGSPRRGERLLVVSDAVVPAEARLRAAHLALVQCLGDRAAAPVRVSVASPATGSVHRVPVDDDLLALGADRAAEFVAHLRLGERAPTLAGPGCATCHLLDTCPDGAARTAAAAADPA